MKFSKRDKMKRETEKVENKNIQARKQSLYR